MIQRFEYETLDSTNEEAKRLLSQGLIRHTAWIWAREQTAGRGTQGRRWASPKDGGLYLTIVQRIPQGEMQSLPSAGLLTLAAGVACAEVLQTQLGLALHLKPINDLYAQGRKLGGILTESLVQEGKITALMTGIGINTAQLANRLPEEAVQPISLEELLPPHQFERLFLAELVQALAEQLQIWHHYAFNDQKETILSQWKRFQMPNTTLPLF